jgi:hypothetical protein
MQEVDKLRAERNAVASAMKGKLEIARREELIEQGIGFTDVSRTYQYGRGLCLQHCSQGLGFKVLEKVSGH